jgi:hypothetical protein
MPKKGQRYYVASFKGLSFNITITEVSFLRKEVKCLPDPTAGLPAFTLSFKELRKLHKL